MFTCRDRSVPCKSLSSRLTKILDNLHNNGKAHIVEPAEPEPSHQQRPKRGHDHSHDYDDDHKGTSGVTGPVHTFVKTDKNANYKWGVRHHVGDKYAS
ncbi:Uncharacterized protein OBRU01_04100 [Operophtera brumata]|uniref:Uncharacterized protein n=1 Tax=Operophtera brumata TaxID=104452 RepID=A0A0L7LQ42_OPEBR|nr:Uncharacterized protein OBRU01_04100 [Operophtera brumata]